MAKDQALLEDLKAGKIGPTIRIYGWSQSCATIGVSVPKEKARKISRGLCVVRRPTGGGWVIHTAKDEITIALAAFRPKGKAVVELYRAIHEAIKQALCELGFPVELVMRKCVSGGKRQRASLPLVHDQGLPFDGGKGLPLSLQGPCVLTGPAGWPASWPVNGRVRLPPTPCPLNFPCCFEDPPCLYDGVMNGKKVLGGGLRLTGSCFLYQGTVRLAGVDPDLLAQKLRCLPGNF